MRNLKITNFLLILISCSSSEVDFRKYDVEKGIINYSYKHPLKNNLIEQKVYFSNYGSTEFFEYVNEEDFPTFPILKKDSLEYTFVSDSMSITSERIPMSIFENLIFQKDSKLVNKDLIVRKKTDTIIFDKNCKLIEFEILKTGQNGKAALWKGIPVWVKSQWEKGLYENINLISLDLKSEIPIEKTKMMDYVDIE